MNKKLFWFLLILFSLFFVYLTEEVPCCRFINFNHTKVEISNEDISEIKSSAAINLNIEGISMTPTIVNGSNCFCLKKNDYSVGDIIMFALKIDDEWTSISHRIVLINETGIYTKGDYNNFIDQPIQKENIACFIPYVQRWMLFG